MSKSAEAFRTISEVADVLDTPAHVLRFWESRFTQIKPVKRAGGRRYYRPADVALLSGIKKLLHDDGLTIRGVQKILREHGIRHVADFAVQDFEAEESPSPQGISLAAAPKTDAPPLRAVTDGMPDDTLPANDLFAAVNRPAAPISSGTFGAALPNTTRGVDARAELQRDRAAATQMQTPVTRGLHRDLPPVAGDPTPAAALLRAMTAVRAGRRREELKVIYARLLALHARRVSQGHSRSD